MNNLCACGCGLPVKSKTAKFITGHHMRLIQANPVRDLTGEKCKHCDVILNSRTHSNRSKLSEESNSSRRAWRICKECLKNRKSLKRNNVKDREYNRKYRVEKWNKVLEISCKRRARESSISCSLTSEDILEIFQRQKGKCYWYEIDLKPSSSSKTLNQPSIDRIDPSGNYDKENCVISSYFADIGRRNTNHDLYKSSVKKIKKSIKDHYGK